MVASCLTALIGATKGRLSTATPIRIRVVTAARNPMVAIGSSTLVYWASSSGSVVDDGVEEALEGPQRVVAERLGQLGDLPVVLRRGP